GNSAIHPGAAEACNGVDDNCNGIVDESFDQDGDGRSACGGDCNDANPAVWSAPSEVNGVMVGASSPTSLSWMLEDISAGPETLYDVVSGVVSTLAGFDPSLATCLAPGRRPPAADSRAAPAVGRLYWYLVRAP